MSLHLFGICTYFNCCLGVPKLNLGLCMIIDLYDLSTSQLRDRRLLLSVKITRTRSNDRRYKFQDEFDLIAQILRERTSLVLSS